MDLGVSFVDLGQKDEYGQTPLLTPASNYSTGYDLRRFDLFLRRGTNIHACNNWGETCLHVCLSSAKFCEYSNEQESLVL